MISAIVVAAGSSRRMGFDKLFADLAGRPVLAWSLEVFQKHPEIAEVIVVTSEANQSRVEALGLADQVVLGGAERHESVWNGLEAVASDTKWVAVHDGARPLIAADTISAGLALAQERKAAAVARPVTETMKRADAEGRVLEAVDRDGLWAMETPQCFDLALLRRAYEAVRSAGRLVTDEVSALEEIGESVYLAANGKPNLKITFPEDLAWSCAYGAREMDLAAGVMKKCTLCVDRIYNDDLEEVDRQPACVKTCPAGARHFGDLADPMSDVSILVKERGGFDLMPEQGNKPVNKYLPPRQRTSLADAAPMPVPEAPVEADGLLGWVDRLLSVGASSGKGVN
ncbi:MAG: 2-C-methyl-D-erythritol 4-phosphate cytidylyltransferase [Pseudomonadota bacterium]